MHRVVCIVCNMGGRVIHEGEGGVILRVGGGDRGLFFATCLIFSFLLCSSVTVSEKLDLISLTRSLYV